MADVDYAPNTLMETVDDEGEEGQAAPGVITPDVLREILAAQDKRTADYVDAKLGRRAQPGVPLQRDNIVPNLNLELEGLPDPQVVGAAAFLAEHTKRVNAAAAKFANDVRTQARNETTQLISDQKALDKVEAMILDQVDVSQEVLGQASKVVAGRYQQQGIDPMAELRRRPTEIAQEIVDYLGEMAEQLGGRAPERGGVDRTAGLVESRGRVRTHREERKAKMSEKDRPKPDDMFRQLTKIQHDAKLY